MEKDNCRIFSFFLGTIKKKALSLQRKNMLGLPGFDSGQERYVSMQCIGR